MHRALCRGGEHLVDIAEASFARERQSLLVGAKSREARIVEGQSDVMHDLPQRRPRMFFVALAPQQTDQTFARILRIVRQSEIGGQCLGLARRKRNLALVDPG
ncbi:hypothetical protein RAD16_01040 [Bradyrhizobium sp. 18BD]